MLLSITIHPTKNYNHCGTHHAPRPSLLPTNLILTYWGLIGVLYGFPSKSQRDVLLTRQTRGTPPLHLPRYSFIRYSFICSLFCRPIIAKLLTQKCREKANKVALLSSLDRYRLYNPRTAELLVRIRCMDIMPNLRPPSSISTPISATKISLEWEINKDSIRHARLHHLSNLQSAYKFSKLRFLD